MRKYAKTHEPVTWEDRLGRDVPLSEVSLPFRARVQAFSKKCGVFRALRCFLIGLVGLIRWCLRYQAIFIVFDSVRRHKNSDYSKKALKLMREYAKINEFGVAERRTGLLFLVHSQSTQTPRGVCLWVACWHQWKIAHGTNNPNRSDVTCNTVPTDFLQRPVCVHYSPHKGRPKHARTLSAKKDKYVKYDKICHLGSRSKYKTGPNHSRDKSIPTA